MPEEEKAEKASEPRGSVFDDLRPFAVRAHAVKAGTDTYTAADIQKILAALVTNVDTGSAG